MRRALLVAGGGGSFSVPRWISTATLLGYLAGGFTKSGSNPVLPKGPSGQWDDWGVRELRLVTDTKGLIVTESDGIWAYYVGFPDGTSTGPAQVGLAKSTDGGDSWTRYVSNPVIANGGTGWYQNDIAQPAPVKLDDGTRVMLAQGRNSVDTDSIGCLTSTNGLTWSDAGQKLTLSSFNDGAATLTQMGVPTLIKRSSGDWLLLCEVLSNTAANAWRIYGATATDPTSTWTVLNSGAPLLGPTGAGWESVGVANPQIIENDTGEYFLMYNGINAYWQVGFAYGTTLTSLTRYASNPVLTKGAGGAWDDQQVESDYLPKEPTRGSLRVSYQGYSAVDGSMQVGYATTP